MTVPHTRAARPNFFGLERTASCWDPQSECTLVFAHPAAERDLARLFIHSRGDHMIWETPTFVEIDMNAEIGAYQGEDYDF